MDHKPWEETDVWKSESQYLIWLRGNLRKALWQHFPPRIAFKNERCINVTPNIREQYGLSKACKYVGVCEFCEEYHPKSKLEVDHIEGCGALTLENKSEWIDRLICSTSNMRLVCKPCHKIHTYSERMGISFESAKLEKKVIEFSKKPTSMQNTYLKKRNLPHNNAKVRKESFRKVLLEDSKAEIT